MTSEHRHVRPTLDCLDVLGLKRPPLDMPLHQMDHPLIAKAQKISELLECGDAEPILSLRDRRWLKVKTGDYRGGVTIAKSEQAWSHVCDEDSLWLGLAGKRQSDTPSKDFYACLPPNTEAYLPQVLDWKRWYAEQAFAAKTVMQQMVRKCAWLSLRLSKAYCFQIGDALIWVRVRMMDSNIVYIAIGAHGLADPKTYAVLMSSFPGTPPEDWLPEPNGVAEIAVEEGEMVFSTILDPTRQALLMNEADQEEWTSELNT